MEFLVRLGTPEGQVLEQVHQASNEPALRHELERRGYHLFEVRRRGLALALPRFRRSERPVPTQEFLIYNQELASLLKAGLPLLQALQLLLERRQDGHFKEILTDVFERVRTGEELSDAFAAHSAAFPRLYPASLKAGERSGELEQVLRRFVRYLKLVTDARKKVVSALAYPAVLVGVSLAMITVLALYVVPQFEEFFVSMNVELPWITRAILAISAFLIGNAYWLVPALVIGLFVLVRWSRTDGGRYVIDRFKLRLPFLGPVLRRFSLSELCRSLATLLAGGIPLVQSFEIASQAVTNAFVRRRVEPTIQQVREGGAFHEALESSGVFLPLAIDMVKVGEATGSLDEMLIAVSDFLDEQVETRMQRVLSLIEPLLLVFLGLVIALLLISIYLPLFGSLGQSGI